MKLWPGVKCANKKTIVVVTMLVIAVIFIIGADWAGEKAIRLFHRYFADIAIPFGYYLLLALIEEKYKFFKNWYIKAGAFFVLCSLSETPQYFGVYALATVFDPFDYIMYALGVDLGVFFDRIIFKRMFSFWK
jgi:hypothetical protein